jgi:hypothetical protein
LPLGQANGLLIIKSFAASFDMDINIVFPTIAINLKVMHHELKSQQALVNKHKI